MKMLKTIFQAVDDNGGKMVVLDGRTGKLYLITQLENSSNEAQGSLLTEKKIVDKINYDIVLSRENKLGIIDDVFDENDDKIEEESSYLINAKL